MDAFQESAEAALCSASQHETDKRDKAQEFKTLGNEKFNKNNYRGAVGEYKKGLMFDPNNADLHANMSAAYLQLEKYIEAEEHAVVTMYLKPTFYKGYMRAAKAAHAKNMTTLALKRIDAGISQVTDANGLRELNRLKTQYSDYLSLTRNADNEIDFTHRYHSSDEEFIPMSDDDDDVDQQDHDPDSGPTPSTINSVVDPLKETTTESKEKVNSEDLTDRTKLSVSTAAIPGAEEASEEVSIAGTNEEESSEAVEKESLKCNEPGGEDKTKVQALVEEEVKDAARGEINENPPTSNSEDQLNIPDETEEQKEDKPDRFLELCKELTRDPNLSQHVEEFLHNVKMGKEAFSSGNYRKAVDCFKAAKERVGLPGVKLSDYGIEDRQYHILLLVYSTALINLSSYDDIVKGIQTLLDMKLYGFSIPAIYIQIARGYCKLNRFKSAKDTLDELTEILDNFPIFPTFTWFGSADVIQETTPSGLQSTIQKLNNICKMSHKPTATCRYEHCLKSSTHIVPSEFIYLSDPDFAGFVRMICEEKCHIDFHISCWKLYKESAFGIGKINDKDLLGRRCLTTDCVNCEGESSLITTIEIIGLDGQVKSVNKLEPKTAGEPNADSKKSKKKKCKIDDKEKTGKPKKSERRKLRDIKKSTVVSVEEVEEPAEPEPEEEEPSIDPEILLENHKETLLKMRELKFGHTNPWEPDLPYYGQSELAKKWTEDGTDPVHFTDPEDNESVEVKDAKDFLCSYVLQILKEEGPLKMADVEILWNQSAADFCDMTVLLPELTSICDLLVESSYFCVMEDYICLASQLEEAYNLVESEVSETVLFLMTEPRPSSLPDLVQNPQSSRQFHASASASDNDSYSEDEYNSNEESEDSDSEESEDDDNLHHSDPISEESFILLPSTSEVEDKISLPNDESQPNTIIKTEDNLPLLERLRSEEPQQNLELKSEPMTLQSMLDKMQELTNMFERSINTEQKVQKEDKDVLSSDTFETAHGSSLNTSNNSNDREADDLEAVESDNITEVDNSQQDIQVSSEQDAVANVDNVTPSAHVSSEEDAVGDVDKATSSSQVSSEQDAVGDADNVTPSVNNEQNNEKILPTQSIKAGETVCKADCNKASQSGVTTKDKLLQTSALERKDKLTQTKESDLYKVLNKKLEEAVKQNISLSEVNAKLTEKVKTMENIKKDLKRSQDEAATNLNRLRDEYNKNVEILKAELNIKLTKINEMKQQEEIFAAENSKLLEMIAAMSVEKENLKKEINLTKKGQKETETKKKMLELKNYALQKECKTKVQISQKDHLQMIRAFWEMQINMLKKKGVEKIGEMHSWFSSVLPPEEVQNLPSMTAISKHIIQWSEINKKLDHSSAAFIDQYNKLEAKINQGEEVDVSSLTVPTLPEEPSPLCLSQIHKELMEKCTDKIKELTELVANQQLEIAKSKQNNQQIQQLMDSFKMPTPPPPIQPPMTTAFGSLALQYPYPQPPPHFYPPPIPTIPPNKDTSKVGNATKPYQAADVHTLLQESSKLASMLSSNQEKTLKKFDPAVTRSAPPNFLSMPPPPVMAPLTLDSPDTSKSNFPPITEGVGHSLFKSSDAPTEAKDKKPAEHSTAPKPEIVKAVSGSSRETTPVSESATPNPTPKKSKKKKKNKSEKTEVKDFLDLRIATPPLSAEATVSENDSHVDWQSTDGTWSVVMPKSSMFKHTVPPTAPVTDVKMKNKKKLLELLQQKLPSTPTKDLDDIVKVVREQNNGSLSGLPFDEIIFRVERFIARRHFQKNSTMGLVKFSDAAWGPVKQQEKIWSNLQLEECTICLEPMGNERTKVECNHEFHTKCLRKWLKEKSVCPLCNKFTTMPDEFPAL